MIDLDIDMDILHGTAPPTGVEVEYRVEDLRLCRPTTLASILIVIVGVLCL